MTQFPETRESLIVQVKDPRNREAWALFADIYQPVIYRIARARGLQHADALDLTQQVLLAVATSIGRYEKSDKSIRFRHWLRRVARNAIINSLTRRPSDQATGNSSMEDLSNQRRDRESEPDSLFALEYHRELYLRAAEIVRTDVNCDTWKAFELTVIEGFSNSDAAIKLDKSIGTIYAARSRVMKRLRDAVADIEESQQ